MAAARDSTDLTGPGSWYARGLLGEWVLNGEPAGTPVRYRVEKAQDHPSGGGIAVCLSGPEEQPVPLLYNPQGVTRPGAFTSELDWWHGDLPGGGSITLGPARDGAHTVVLQRGAEEPEVLRNMRHPGDVKLTAPGGTIAQGMLGDWCHVGEWPEQAGGEGLSLTIVPLRSHPDGGIGPAWCVGESAPRPLLYRPSGVQKPDKLAAYDWWHGELPGGAAVLGPPNSHHGKCALVLQVGDAWVCSELGRRGTWEAEQPLEDRPWMRRFTQTVDAAQKAGRTHPDGPTELLPGKLFVGDAGHAESWSLRRHDFTAVCCVASRYCDTATQMVRRLDIDADDPPPTAPPYPLIESHLDQVVEFINEEVTHRGGKVLVHCQLGRNRSVALCAGYLIKAKRWPLLRTVRHITARRNGIFGNWTFRAQLIALARREGLLDEDPEKDDGIAFGVHVEVGSEQGKVAGFDGPGGVLVDFAGTVRSVPAKELRVVGAPTPASPTGAGPPPPGSDSLVVRILGTYERFSGVYVQQPEQVRGFPYFRQLGDNRILHRSGPPVQSWTGGGMRWIFSESPESLERGTGFVVQASLLPEDILPQEVPQWKEWSSYDRRWQSGANVTVRERIPQVLFVESARDPDLSGKYVRAEGETNGFPKWQRRGGKGVVLATDDDHPSWVVCADPSEAEDGLATLRSLEPHRGRMPQELKAWGRLGRTVGTWEPAQDVTIQDAAGKAVAEQEQSRVRSVLDGILKAQCGGQYYSYEDALAEIRAGYKRGCWIWWIFPHLQQLRAGTQYPQYLMPSVSAFRDYIRHETLIARLREITSVVLDHLRKGVTLAYVMGGWDDAKFREMAACFAAAAAAEGSMQDLDLFGECIDRSGGFESRARSEILNQWQGDPELSPYGEYIAGEGASGVGLRRLRELLAAGTPPAAAIEAARALDSEVLLPGAAVKASGLQDAAHLNGALGRVLSRAQRAADPPAEGRVPVDFGRELGIKSVKRENLTPATDRDGRAGGAWQSSGRADSASPPKRSANGTAAAAAAAPAAAAAAPVAPAAAAPVASAVPISEPGRARALVFCNARAGQDRLTRIVAALHPGDEVECVELVKDSQGTRVRLTDVPLSGGGRGECWVSTTRPSDGATQLTPACAAANSPPKKARFGPAAAVAQVREAAAAAPAAADDDSTDDLHSAEQDDVSVTACSPASLTSPQADQVDTDSSLRHGA